MKPSSSLDLLEIGRFREVLAALTSSFLGRSLVSKLVPLGSPREASEVLGHTDALRRLAETGSGVPPIEVGDLGAIFLRLGREGSCLDPTEFAELERLLKSLAAVRPALLAAESEALGDLAAPLEPQPHLERALERTFDPGGTIRDGASTRLRSIRRERERLRERLRNRLQKLASKHSGPDAESVVTLRDGRYVVTIPAGQRSDLPGLVMDRSGSGQTLYIEPLSSVEDNNALREKDAEEREEIQRILAELTAAFAAVSDSLVLGWEHLGTIDALRARARLARRWGGEPPVFDPDLRLRLTGARHPLLLEARGAAESLEKARAQVVPLAIELDADRRIVLVTGPNMGGKTVALKCVGLLSVMAQCGCPIPADPGCRLPWVRRWVVDVGDEQSLDRDLSTFGAHLERWAQALDSAGAETLVLLDELGSGTDPVEGAALAQSVLERLAEAGGLGLVTTHLGTLKGFAAETDGVQNASMVFDPESREPTFSLLLGVPGESHALEMARRLGFPAERVRRAEDLLPGEERSVRRLLADLEQERTVIAREREELEGQREEAKQLHEEARIRLQRFLDERADLRARAARQAREILRRAEESGKRVAQGEGKRSKPHKELAREHARLSRLESRRREVRVGRPPERVRVGERYWADSLSRVVEVVRDPDAGRVLVGHGALRVEIPLSTLRLVSEEPADTGEAKRKTAPPPRQAAVTLPETEDVEVQVDLRGLRVDEAVSRLEQAIDRGLLGGLTEIRVVHGKGTGALQKVVEEYCRKQPAVKSFRVGERWEGGSGATVIVLEG